MSLSLSPCRQRLALAAATALVLALVTSVLAPVALAVGKEGWGRFPTFIGRYHARILSGGKLHVVGGELTMFPQEEFPGSVQPAGILKLKTKRGNNDLVYLTELAHRARGRFATINGGAFVGPKIGSFGARMPAPGRLRATFSTGGLGTVRAVFVRYSTSPTP
ncbi:MAG: hypothetical protein JST31_03920 [Actinobacteria bacterium]|nr:hypothetical protein [Actinomycetota bacterium]